jgi:hypothetical protein
VTYAVAALLIIGVAAWIAAPFLSTAATATDPRVHPDTERLEREKSAALLAIREAQLDKAMGKLSDDDYAGLRDFYERRAIAAMADLDRAGANESVARETTANCSGCGTRLQHESAYCAVCGERSSVLPL